MSGGEEEPCRCSLDDLFGRSHGIGASDPCEPRRAGVIRVILNPRTTCLGMLTVTLAAFYTICTKIPPPVQAILGRQSRLLSS